MELPGAFGFGMLICAPATEATPNNEAASRLVKAFMGTPFGAINHSR
jgi:hypothetical protein